MCTFISVMIYSYKFIHETLNMINRFIPLFPFMNCYIDINNYNETMTNNQDSKLNILKIE